MKPRLLDLFCGAGGCSVGYERAGFEVVGVDIEPQPNYPFEFWQGDALDAASWCVEADEFDAIHASPPCQFYSQLAAMHPSRDYPDLIPETRRLLQRIGLPYVIENVEAAPLDRAPDLFGAEGAVLCGSMFGLGVERGYLKRHRTFEANFPIGQPTCAHNGVAVGVYGHGGHSGKHRMLYRDEAAEAMGIDWMTRDEMTQAIPPAYTEHIGGYLLSHLQAAKEVA